METLDRPFGFDARTRPRHLGSPPVDPSFAVWCQRRSVMALPAGRLNLRRGYSSGLNHFDRIAVRVPQYGADDRLGHRGMDASAGYFHKLQETQKVSHTQS
jgi:hypothetical protein